CARKIMKCHYVCVPSARLVSVSSSQPGMNSSHTGCGEVSTDGTTIAMHRWSPLNDRQLALLTRIKDGADPVTSDSPEFARAVRARKVRRLITMPKQDGKWRAVITDAGRFYLELGAPPDRPEPPPRKQRWAGSGRRTRPAPPPEKQDTAPSTT